MVQTWFTDGPSQMNPNLNYDQATPGIINGSASSTDFADLASVIDAVALIGGGSSASSTNTPLYPDLVTWFHTFSANLQASRSFNGQLKDKNNHGTWADTVLASASRAAGDASVAARILAAVPTKRVNVQIDPSGALPFELARADPLHYVAYALLVSATEWLLVLVTLCCCW